MEKRLDQLDAIRGLASLSVFLYHISLVTILPILPLITAKYSPLKIFINGHGAVILFFILSGFVLTLPYLNKKNTSYMEFLIKRFFRIYIPYLVAILLAIVTCSLFSRGRINSLSDWFNISWTDPITLKIIMQHLLMLGNFNTNAFDNVIWSLVHELRISIIFPLVAYILIRYSWKTILMICIALSLVSGLNNIFNLEVNQGFQTTFFSTFHYISMFLIGGLISKHKNDLVKLYSNLSVINKVLLCLIAFVSYNYYEVVISIANKVDFSAFSDILGDYSITDGATLILVISLGSKKVTKILLKKPLSDLGKISYSLYLYHLIVLTSLIHILYHKIQMGLIFLLAIFVAFVITTISYRYIELPAIRLGKRIIKMMFRNNQRNLIM